MNQGRRLSGRNTTSRELEAFRRFGNVQGQSSHSPGCRFNCRLSPRKKSIELLPEKGQEFRLCQSHCALGTRLAAHAAWVAERKCRSRFGISDARWEVRSPRLSAYSRSTRGLRTREHQQHGVEIILAFLLFLPYPYFFNNRTNEVFHNLY